MTGRQAVGLALPAVVVLLAALPFGPTHRLSAALAAGLTVPVAFGTFLLTRWLSVRHPLGGVIGMMVGTVLRLAVAFGAGAAVFLLAPGLREVGVVFWLWLLFAYLASLLAETVLLVRTSSLAAGGAASEKG